MNPWYSLMRKLGAQPWLPKFAPAIIWTDRTLQRVSGGRVSFGTLVGLQELTLITIGRKSGLERSTPLVYLPHQGGYAVIGSNWGKPHRPAWVLNLLASPSAVVEVRGRRESVTARFTTGDERELLWARVVEVWPAYRTYAQGVSREIAVVVLSV